MKIIFVFNLILLYSCSSGMIEKRALVSDYSHYKTFQWSDHNSKIENTNSNYDNENIRRRIASAIQCELEERNKTFVDNNADLVIEFHIIVEKKMATVVDIHEYYSTPFGYQNVEQRQIQYHEGTIMVEFIDTKTDRIVWYGIISEILSPNPDWGKQKEKITKAFNTLFLEF